MEAWEERDRRLTGERGTLAPDDGFLVHEIVDDLDAIP
jgi:hypothetical protein